MALWNNPIWRINDAGMTDERTDEKRGKEKEKNKSNTSADRGLHTNINSWAHAYYIETHVIVWILIVIMCALTHTYNWMYVYIHIYICTYVCASVRNTKIFDFSRREAKENEPPTNPKKTLRIRRKHLAIAITYSLSLPLSSYRSLVFLTILPLWFTWVFTHMHVSTHVHTYACMHVCVWMYWMHAHGFGLSSSVGANVVCFSPFRMSLSFAGSFLFIFHPFIVVHYACPLIFALYIHAYIRMYVHCISPLLLYLEIHGW